MGLVCLGFGTFGGRGLAKLEPSSHGLGLNSEPGASLELHQPPAPKRNPTPREAKHLGPARKALRNAGYSLDGPCSLLIPQPSSPTSERGNFVAVVSSERRVKEAGQIMDAKQWLAKVASCALQFSGRQ